MIRKTFRVIFLSIQVAFMKAKMLTVYQRNYFKYKEAFYGLTLNSVGPLYGVQRIKNEPNRKYEKRILKVACCNPPIKVDDVIKKEGADK